MSRSKLNVSEYPGLHRAAGDTYPPLSHEMEVVTRADDITDESPISRSAPDVSAAELSPVKTQLDQATRARLAEQIKTVASTIRAALGPDLPDALQTRLAEWCDLHGFETPPNWDTQTRTVVAREAALNILFRVTLYERYHRYDRLPSLTGDIRSRLRQARVITDDDAFEESVLDAIAWRAGADALEPLINRRSVLLNSGAPADDIGALYAAVIEPENRKVVGHFRTPPAIADIMRRWAVTDGDVVLDPGIGSATLSSPGYPNWILSTDPDCVFGIDRDPLARLMGSLALSLAGQNHETHTTDFFDVGPSSIPASDCAIICNPPYTTYSYLPKEYRAKLNEQAEQETGRSIPGKTPLYGYFVYHARQLLTPGDRFAVIVSQRFLSRQYGTVLKQYILDMFDICSLVIFDPTNKSVFDDADETAMVLFLKAKEPDESSGTTRLIKVDDWDTDEWKQALRCEQEGATDWGHVIHTEQTTLEAEADWRQQFTNPPQIKTPYATPLTEIAEVRLGTVTGASELFCLDQTTVRNFSIDDQYLIPLIRSISDIDGCEYTWSKWESRREAGEEVWLLSVDDLKRVPASFQDAKEESELWATNNQSYCGTAQPVANVVEYLQSNITDISSKKLENYPPWYRVEDIESATLLVQGCFRDSCTVVLNRTDAVNLNNAHCVDPDSSLSTADRKALAAFLNSRRGQKILKHTADVESSGRYPIRLGDLQEMEVIDPRTLDTAVVDTLATLFTDLTAADGDKEDKVLDRIDDVLATYFED